MPSGRTHLGIELGVLVLAVAGGISWVQAGGMSARALGAFSGAYAFSMVFLSPDLDLADSRPMRRWGPLSFLWRPYAWIFRHRGASHDVVWGPLTRLLYLGVLVLAAGVAVSAALGRPILRGLAERDVAAVLAGVYAPSVVHVFCDQAWSALKRRRRR
jgi:uncharacterized metal-binding protein